MYVNHLWRSHAFFGLRCDAANVIDDAAALVLHHVFELWIEMLQETLYGPGGSVTQGANCVPFYLVGDIQKLCEIILLPLALHDSRQHAI